MPRFLDTNILVRHLTRDDEEKAQACRSLLLRAELREEVLVTSDLVIAEAVYVLQSPRQYGLPRDLVRQLLEPLINLRGVRLTNKFLYSRVFDLYCQSNISFNDAYIAAFMESRGLDEVYSYDTDFDRIEGISRIEPSAVP